MHRPLIIAFVLTGFLILCLPGVSAAPEAISSADVPDFSSCEFTNGTLNPYCPIWDGEHREPDPFLVYDVRRNFEESTYGISSLQPPPGWRGLPTKGTVKIPVFLVDFSDAPHDPAQTVAEVQSKMFGNGNGGYPYESLKNYYQRSSYNQLIINGEVYGWYRAAQPRDYYLALGRPQGRDALINEILQAYDSQVNFADYDADHNGKIDALFIKWAGTDNGWGNFWWACMSSSSSSLTVDGAKPYKYVWSWYSKPNGSAYYPQVDIHETGHLLGLPDYYDYDSTNGPKGGVGGWDMMDYNWGDHNAFSKYLLGWIDPMVISEGTREIILPPSGTTPSGNAVLIMPGAVPDSFGEFFMVQYREPGNGNDPFKAGLNKSVWIWHVDSTLTSSGWGFQYDNSYASHKLLRLMEADGREEIEAGNGYWDTDDFYLPGNALGPLTIPNTNAYAGSQTNVAVDTLAQFNSSMHMNVSIPAEGTFAAFIANVTSGTPPLTVRFTDTSTGAGISAWTWDFNNDTIIDSTSQHPIYTYTSPGTYTVNHTASGAGGSDREVRVRYINVTPGDFSGIGIYRNGTWYLDSNGNGAWDAGTDYAYNFGATGWTPVAGDWNGDNTTDIGVYLNGFWYRDYNGNGTWDTGTDSAGNFGAPGWTPVIGDWNGDGRTDIGVYQNGIWYCDYNGNGVWDAGNDTIFNFGAAGWTPVIGDWNGDGRTEIGIYRNGTWYRDYNGNGAWDAGLDNVFNFGAAGWVPVAGDWNGDGKTDSAVYLNGFWYRDYNGNGAWDAGLDNAYNFGASGWSPVLGDWNGDSRADIGVYRDGIWYRDFNGNSIWDAGTDTVVNFGAAGWSPVVGKWS